MSTSLPLSEAKVLGVIGSILILFTAVPNVGILVGIAGFVLILLAIKKISEAVGDKSIFQNMRNAILLAIGAVVVGAITVFGTIFRVLGMGSLVGSKFVLAPSSIRTGEWLGIGLGVMGGLLAVCAILLVSAVFVRRSMTSTGAKLHVNRFETAGLLYLIGSATAVIGVGFVIIFVAEIYLALSFYSIKENSQAVSPANTIPSVVTPS